jgi:hypothetical protein
MQACCPGVLTCCWCLLVWHCWQVKVRFTHDTILRGLPCNLPIFGNMCGAALSEAVRKTPVPALLEQLGEFVSLFVAVWKRHTQLHSRWHCTLAHVLYQPAKCADQQTVHCTWLQQHTKAAHGCCQNCPCTSTLLSQAFVFGVSLQVSRA